MPGIFEQRGERVAHDGATAVTHMHGAGGVGGDIFDIDRNALTRVGPAIVAAFCMDRRQFGAPGGIGQRQVDEAGASNGGAFHLVQLFKARDDLFGQRARVGACGLGEDHGGVGGEVAMARVAGRLDRHRLAVEASGQGAIRLQRVQHGVQMGGETNVERQGTDFPMRPVRPEPVERLLFSSQVEGFDKLSPNG